MLRKTRMSAWGIPVWATPQATAMAKGSANTRMRNSMAVSSAGRFHWAVPGAGRWPDAASRDADRVGDGMVIPRHCNIAALCERRTSQHLPPRLAVQSEHRLDTA
jgi:hypothetical protein